MNLSVVAIGAFALLLEIAYPRIDPVLFDLPGPLAVRWYGLMFIASFTLGYFILKWLARTEFLKLDPERTGDLLFVLIIGIILGSRIGYMLFYDAGGLADDPSRIIRIWQGGLSFHGGLIGVLLAAIWYTRRHGIPFLNLGDAMALATPFGIIAVRTANFINGELFGRITDASVPWAMRFPTDPVALEALGADRAVTMRQREIVINQAFDSGAWEAVRDQVPLRHPSQLYEALLEGVVLAMILWGVFWMLRRANRRLPHGLFGGIFLIGYGVFRSIAELFRQPDAQFRSPEDPLGTVLGPLTMGQTLSALMILGGIGLLIWVWRGRHEPETGQRRARRRKD